MSADKGESDSFMAPIVALTDENRALKARLAEAEGVGYLTKEQIQALEDGADEIRSLVYPDRGMRFASDGISAVRHMRVISGEIVVQRNHLASREQKRAINHLPSEVNGFPVIVKDVRGSCMLCGFSGATRREQQRHHCDD